MKVKDFDKIALEILKSISFSKKKYSFIKQIDENIFGTIGFTIASQQRPGSLFVNPVVGVFNKKIEETYFKLTGIDTLSLFQPTISSPIGYLMPSNDYKEWEYAEVSDISSLNMEMLDAIKSYGLPFMEKYKNQNELLKCLEERKFILNQSRDYRLPILYYLRGEKDKGLQSIETSIERQKKPIDESNFPKFNGTKKEVTIVGSGYGKVAPEYLKFAENYKAL